MKTKKFKFMFLLQNDISMVSDYYLYFDSYDQFLDWYELRCKYVCNIYYDDWNFILICVNLLNNSYRSFYTDDWNKVCHASYFYQFISEASDDKI